MGPEERVGYCRRKRRMRRLWIPPSPPDSAYRICYKMAPPKVGILIQNTISKFSKTKNLTQKDPQKLQKIKKFYKTHPPKSGNSDSKYTLEIFKNQKIKLKKPPKFPKIKNIYKEASNQKVL